MGLSCFCVHFACLTKFSMTGFVSVYVMGVEGSLFTLVQSFYTCLSMVFGYVLLLS